jgi:hypothetical protein
LTILFSRYLGLFTSGRYRIQYPRDFFDRFGEEARQVLNQMLDKYIEFGTGQPKRMASQGMNSLLS